MRQRDGNGHDVCRHSLPSFPTVTSRNLPLSLSLSQSPAGPHSWPKPNNDTKKENLNLQGGMTRVVGQGRVGYSQWLSQSTKNQKKNAPSTPIIHCFFCFIFIFIHTHPKTLVTPPQTFFYFYNSLQPYTLPYTITLIHTSNYILTLSFI